MTDRLLTDEEILAIISDNYGAEGEPHPIPVGKIADASQLKTLKAVGEWGDRFCVEYNHYGSDKSANTRKRECRKCWQQFSKGVLND